MSFLEYIDKNIIQNVFNSNEFKGWLLSKRWFSDKFILSNLDFKIEIPYFERIAGRIFIILIKVIKEHYEKCYFLPLIYYKKIQDVLLESEKITNKIIKLTENTFSKKIALRIKIQEEIFTLNFIEAEYCLYFWKNLLFDKTISEKYPKLSLDLILYSEQFQDKTNMNKVQNLIEASLYPENYEIQLEQLGMGNTTNLLFKLDLIKKNHTSESLYSYVLKSYKEYHESLEPSTLYIFVQNNFENAPKIYGNIKIKDMDSIGILEYISSDGNVGDIYWGELNKLIKSFAEKIVKDEIILSSKEEMYQYIKNGCSETLKVSESIGKAINNLHKSIILEGDKDYSTSIIESDFYLNNYTHKLNLMIEDLQHLIKQESHNAFYSLPKISSVLIDTKDILEKFRNDFSEKEINSQPVHQDLHMEQILFKQYQKEYKYYFIDFEGDPKLSIEENKEKFPIEKDLAAFLRSLSYIKFNILLKIIEDYFLNHSEHRVPEEILYNLFFRKGIRRPNDKLQKILEIINIWEEKLMSKFLKSIDYNYTLVNFFTIERIIHEINYEILFRPNKFIIPLLGLKELIDKN
ncbi:MAG: hypothetical protein P8Y70_09985 [Candidatus Lokiarchaeota archaeon]